MNARAGLVFASVALALAACDNMANQPRLKPYELRYGSQLDWPLTPPPHTIAQDESLKPPARPPTTLALLKRGQQRFNIACSPCHGRTGEGDGMVVQRGFPKPPSYYSETLRNAPDQLFYDVITHGYGLMYPYADRVAPADRWAIVAYIRALQASTTAKLADVPADQREALR